MKLAAHFYLPSPLLHVLSKLLDEFRDLLGPFLFPFVLHSARIAVSVGSMPCINQLYGRRRDVVGKSLGS